MRLEVRLVFGHTRFPSAKELALGDALHLGVYRKAKELISEPDKVPTSGPSIRSLNYSNVITSRC
jgi:hypothetical protein